MRKRRNLDLAAVSVVVLMLALVPGTSASDFRSILVDGDAGDWDGATPAVVDPSGDQGSAPVDLGAVWIANDESFIYLRFEIGTLYNLQGLPKAIRLHIDGDDDIGTGYQTEGIGSDVLVEFSSGGFGLSVFEQLPGNFFANEIGHGALDVYTGATVADDTFEVRLRRDGFLPLHGDVAFPTSSFKVALVALDVGNLTGDAVPDVDASLSYTMATGTSTVPDNDTAKLDPSHVRFLSYNSEFGSLFDDTTAQRTRILQALDPDVIAFQELWDYSTSQVVSALNADLPIAGTWVAIKGNRGQITASRHPMTNLAGGPWGELSTIVDLPEDDYDTDVLVINSHFKCCGSIGTSEDQQRQDASDSIIGWIRELQTPGGLELPDGTPIVNLGDFNLVGGPQPLATLVTGNIIDEVTYGPDHAPDWDGSDFDRAAPLHTDGVAAYTWRRNTSSFGPGKLDYIFYTASAAAPGNAFVLNTLDMSPSKLASLGLLANDTSTASDHLPLVLDLAPGGATAVPPETTAPARSGLRAAPNPFRVSTQIELDVLVDGRVSLAAFDVQGRLVDQLLSSRLVAGRSTLSWEGRVGRGERLAAGVYYLRLEVETTSGRETHIRKVTLLR